MSGRHSSGEIVLGAEAVSRVYRTAAGDVNACVDVSLDLSAGQLLVVTGPSGAGKSTLLGLLGTLDTPTSGSVTIGGADVATLSESAIVDLRRDRLGFVFQSFGLIPILTAAENVEVPLRLKNEDPAVRAERVAEVLELVGLADHANQRPDELSGGQQQRVGIARALVARPDILIADEPTGQLDSGNAQLVMDLIHELVRSQGIAAIVATHDPAFAELADQTIHLRNGHVT
jgi:putative ABC transport system ATP-binding protein